ncbi:hypothetical protein EDB19DRAFT_536794 [Suillus lakei]|nr:hypothetical protein EDB19DRAFT_536794 [Suillus lakei]
MRGTCRTSIKLAPQRLRKDPDLEASLAFFGCASYRSGSRKPRSSNAAQAQLASLTSLSYLVLCQSTKAHRDTMSHHASAPPAYQHHDPSMPQTFHHGHAHSTPQRHAHQGHTHDRHYHRHHAHCQPPMHIVVPTIPTSRTVVHSRHDTHSTKFAAIDTRL